MPAAALPPDEPQRLTALHRIAILDTAPDAMYDALTDLARSVFEIPIAAICLIDADRLWFKSVQGLSVREMPRDVGFCAHAILEADRPLVVPDTTQDPRFADNPLVMGETGIRFYAGIPLRDREGYALGTLCVLDHKPRTVTPDLVQKLEHIGVGVTAALQLQGYAQELGRLALTDPLTGLANRAAFEAHLEEACAKRGRATSGKQTRGAGSALLLFDLDGFRAVNDLFGHGGGDRALREVAERLQRVARNGDLVARLGGDQFALVCDGLTSPEGAMAVAARVHAALADTFALDGQVVPLRTSIGVAGLPWHAMDAEGWIRAADTALYEAKQAGRGATRLAVGREQPGRDGPGLGRLSLQRLLRDALLPTGREPFHLHFQPILDLATGRVSSFEALLRWVLPDGRSVSPATFVSAAERDGLVPHLDRWVLRQACAAAARWPAAWAVSVNLSPATVALMDTVDLVRAALDAAGLPPHRLHVEITETMAVPDSDHMARTIQGLRQIGVTVAMDDFGSGHASLTYLRRHPFNVVKVDQSLVAGLPGDARALPVLRAAVELTRALLVPVVAEGVETAEQLQLLRDLGVTRAQGHLLGRPVPENRVEQAACAAERQLAVILEEQERHLACAA